MRLFTTKVDNIKATWAFGWLPVCHRYLVDSASS